jgi:hypothetical protein
MIGNVIGSDSSLTQKPFQYLREETEKNNEIFIQGVSRPDTSKCSSRSGKWRRSGKVSTSIMGAREIERVFVCVCVFEREREKKRQRERKITGEQY